MQLIHVKRNLTCNPPLMQKHQNPTAEIDRDMWSQISQNKSMSSSVKIMAAEIQNITVASFGQSWTYASSTLKPKALKHASNFSCIEPNAKKMVILLYYVSS